MHELKQAIRNALAGSSSSNPVDTKSLLKLGNSDAVMAALESLLASREVNKALVIRGGTQTVQCWLTGAVVIGRGPQGITLSNTPGMRLAPSRPDLTTPTQPEPVKEKWMSTNKTAKTSEIRMVLHRMISGQPGIDAASLIKRSLQEVKSATEEQAKKALSNMVNLSRELTATGKGDARCYYPNDGKAAQAAEKPSATKNKAKRPAKPASATCTKSQTGADEEFSIVLSESGCVIVDVGFGEFFTLSHTQAERLYRFIGKIHPVLELPA